MRAEYKRDMYRSYLVILPDGAESQGKAELCEEGEAAGKAEETAKKSEPAGYQAKMLQSNKIKGLLPMQIKRIDGQDFYYYDISSLQPYAEIYQKTKLSRKQISQFIEQIIEAAERGKEFLLVEDNFVLEPKYIYVNPGSFKVSLCYLPGYNKQIDEQLKHLFEFILDRADYGEEGAILLAYGFYKQSRSKTVTLSELKQFLGEQNILGQEKQEGTREEMGDKELKTPRPRMEQKGWEENIGRYGREERERGEQMLEIGWKQREEKQSSKDNVGMQKELIFLCIGAVFLEAFILFALYRLDFFTNSLGGQFGTTKFLLFCLVIACIEASALHFWYGIKNGKQKEDTGSELKIGILNTKREKAGAGNMKGDSTRRGNIRRDVSRKDNREKDSFGRNSVEIKNNGLEYYTGCPKPEDAFSGPVIYKYDIETSDCSSMEKTSLLLREDEVYGEQAYCLSAVDSKVYQDIPLLEFPFFVGKLRTNVDYVLEHAAVSRFHAKLEKEEEQFFLTDLNSTNGTFLNGKRLLPSERAELFLGDQVAFAQINYIFNKI